MAKLPTFYYTVKAASDDSANVGVVKAEDADAALAKLDGVYGNTADNKPVEIALVEQSEFARIEAEKGAQLTHKPE